MKFFESLRKKASSPNAESLIIHENSVETPDNILKAAAVENLQPVSKPKKKVKRVVISITSASYKKYSEIINKANKEHDAIIAQALSEKKQIERQALDDIRQQKRIIEHELQQMQEEMRKIDMLISSYESDPWEEFELSKGEYAEKVKLICEKVDKLIADGKAAENLRPFETDAEIKEYQRRYKQIVRCFCSEVDLSIREAASKSFGVINRKIVKTYVDINKMFVKDNIAISELLLELKVQQCIAVYYSKND